MRTTVAQWIAGARPKTLPAAIAPVLVGGAVAYAEIKGTLNFALLGCALLVAISLQIGVNYSNDYSDGIRGTDDKRVGPIRLVGQKLASPRQVKNAALIAFGIAGLAGGGMVLISHYLVLIPIGISAIFAAWFYTGGTKPYGYAGFGELFVFIYFGLVAVIGTSATQSGHISLMSLLAGSACGCMATAILVANNLRDIPGDSLTNKRTLAVRLGDRSTRKLYVVLLVLPFLINCAIAVISHSALVLIGLIPMVLAAKPARQVLRGTTGRDLIPVLAATGKLTLWFGVFLSLGILLGI